MKVMVIPFVVSALGTVSKGLGEKRQGNWNRERIDSMLILALLRSANTQKSLRYRRLAVNQTPVKDNQLMQEGKTHKELNNNNNNNMCKKLKFDHTNKWYMQKPSPVLENNTQKLLRDFGIHTDHFISARRPDLMIINKKKKKRTCKIVDFAVPADHRIKLKECEKKDKYLDFARELKKKSCGTCRWQLYQL